jgi:transcriptional regulator with XRE-family HTH domain
MTPAPGFVTRVGPICSRPKVDVRRPRLDDALRLAEVRQARGLTQADVAAALHVSRPRVAAVEKQRNLNLSTLREYVEAMGGRLEVAAVFDEGRVVIDQAAGREPIET